MRAFCSLTAAFFLLVSGAMAQSDYRAHVLDPPGSVGQSITSQPFTVTFSACFAGELPGGNTADGCFLGINNSGVDWVGLQFVFPNTVNLASQPVDCSPAPNHNAYAQSNCVLDPVSGAYFLDFNGGVIRNTEAFFLTEEGVDPSLFPTGTGTYTTAATPEPSSLVLFLTGIPAAGALLRRTKKALRQERE